MSAFHKKRRRVVRSSLTKLDSTLTKLEADSGNPVILESARNLAGKLNTLQQEFKDHQLAIIDHTVKESVLKRELQALDKNDDTVSEYHVRIQRLIVSATSSKTDVVATTIWGQVWDYLKSHILLPVAAVAILAVAVLAVLIVRGVFFSKEGKIDVTLALGTRPSLLPSFVEVNRSDKVGLLRERFILQNQTNSFGVVHGPSGTGKTYLTRLACNQDPMAGVLYYEIADPSFFPERLARKIGMKLEDDTDIFDLIAEKSGLDKLVNFYKLPQELPLAMSFVLDTLAERGADFRKIHYRMPCLFIDGVDLLAKQYSEVFDTLVDLAKYYANNGMLRIVLVGHDNYIVPHTEQNSHANGIEIIY
jgi:hypothetical protein